MCLPQLAGIGLLGSHKRTPITNKRLIIMLDVEKIRADFPILNVKCIRVFPWFTWTAPLRRNGRISHRCHGRLLSAHHANVHRGIHRLSDEATAAYESARHVSARSSMPPIHNKLSTCVMQPKAFNLVAYSWGHANLKAGDEILLTEMEHHANLVPWQMLAATTGATLRFVPFHVADGTLDLSDLDALLTERTKIFSFTAVSNVFGTVNPVQTAGGRSACGRRTGDGGCGPGRAAYGGGCASVGL